MAEKEVYIIKVEGELVEVSPEVYYAYFRMERQERGQEEKKQQNSVVSYDALDSDETVGFETIPDLTSPSLDDLMMMGSCGISSDVQSAHCPQGSGS